MKRALIVIVPLAVFALVEACSGSAPRCLASNCSGCCDINGECQSGTERFACGSRAGVCSSCAQNEVCAIGICVVSDGGTMGTGGGSATAGGSATGGSGGGTAGAGTCSAATCSGCCANGACQGGGMNMQCGSRGVACMACPSGQACLASDAGTNACLPFTCTGCVSMSGNCLLGTSVSACGSAGGQCRACLSGMSCVNGVCQAAAGCNATTCAGGCCDGTTCIDPPTASKCGRMGGACSTCTGTQVCSAGSCVNGGTAGGSGGTAGGSGSGLCGPMSCASGCCDPLTEAICLPGTDGLSCGRGGGICKVCFPGLQTCTNQQCVF
ncbi:MAG: hypothetical protein JNK82_11630 [Myxococcaceae bacterium]|nr:hypothetical protein [Myxococcaceae bacterium]